ncbi:MAG: nucleoid-associated protein [Pseudolysinimonas sp.]
MADFGTLQLNDVIMHEVPRNARGAELEGVVITDRLVDLDDGDRQFLTRRFRDTLHGRSRPILRDPTVQTSTPDSILRILADPDQVVAESQSITRQLAAVQPGSSNLGLVVVATCSLDRSPGVLVAKVEHQEAMRIEAASDAQGHTFFTVEHLKDLVFGESARIYKVGVFTIGLRAGAVLAGEAIDQQNGLHPAAFFMHSFLGMKLREDPEVLTEQFHSAATIALNDLPANAEQKAAIEGSLIAVLQSNANTIDPRRFVQDFVPAQFQTQFARSLIHESVPQREFSKDLRLVEAKLKRIRIQIENGISIFAPPDQVGPDKAVQLSEAEGSDHDQVVIRGRVTDIASSGSRS